MSGKSDAGYFIEEVELPEDADLEAFVRNKFKAEEELKIERTDKETGSVVFDVMTASIHQRYTIPGFKRFALCFLEWVCYNNKSAGLEERILEKKEKNTYSCAGKWYQGSYTVMSRGHNHSHTHTHTKAVLNRLSRAIGHLESIRRMVEEGRDCSEVLIQLSAVKAAINNTGKVILQDHIEHCIVDAVESGDHEALEELNKPLTVS